MSDPTSAKKQLQGAPLPQVRQSGPFDLDRVPPESVPEDFFEIPVANRAVPVRIEYSAIRELHMQLAGEGESVGLLLGSSSPEAISIQRCELLSLSPATLGDPKSLQGAFRQFIKARSQTPLEDAPELLGCFRTQIAGWPGMRDSDLEITKRSFPAPESLFLLIRTTQHRPWLAALYALDPTTVAASVEPALEFPFDEYLLRNGYLTDLVETAEPVEVPVQPNQTRWIVVALIFAILLAGSVAAYRWYRPAGRSEVAGRNAAGAGPLSLKVNRSGKDFEVSWDRLSTAVQQASNGTLTISDGALTRAVALSGPQLREGRILYTPLFEELTFRLEVATPDLGASVESVQVLAWSGKQTADVLTVAPPDPLTNSPSRIVAGDAAKQLSRLPETKPPGRLPESPKPEPLKPETLKPETLKKDVGSPPQTAAAKSAAVAPANSGKQPPSVKPSTSETASVIQPASPNSARSQDVAPAAPLRVPETPAPAAASERPPVTQPSPQLPASAPASQTPAKAPPVQPPANTPPAQPPANTVPARPPAAPAPKPEAPPVSQNTTAVSTPALPPPAAAPAATPISPSPSTAPPISSGAVVLPVPIQRAAPVPPRNAQNGVAAGVARVISVRVMVDSSGNVQSAEVVSSTPKGAFGEDLMKSASVDAAKKWKFRPGQSNGKNVSAEYTIDFKFQ